MSSRSKGRYFERKVKAYLESIGFTCDEARASLKPLFLPGKGRIFVSSRNDILGCVDILALHQVLPYTLFVQCTISVSDRAKKKAKLLSVKWNSAAHVVQVWSRDDKARGGVRVSTLKADGSWTETRFKPIDGEWSPAWEIWRCDLSDLLLGGPQERLAPFPAAADGGLGDAAGVARARDGKPKRRPSLNRVASQGL